MVKDYSKGYDLGHTDGETGDNKLALRSFQRLGELSSWSPGIDNRDAQFRQGYMNGLEDKIRIRQTENPHTATPSTTFSPTDNGATAMANSGNSYASQIEMLTKIKGKLIDIQRELDNHSTNYRKALDYQWSAGMMKETYEDFVSNELAETQRLIKNLIDHLGANDIPKIQAEIDYLSPKR